MLLVLELDLADPAATRFAVSPLSETLRAVAPLGRPDPPSVNRPWVRWARGELERRRSGRTVLYQASELGFALLRAGADS